MAHTQQTIDQFMSDAGYVIDEFWYPRVTKIVEIKAKPALYRYYAKLGNFALGEKVKEQSASEGTLVHNTIEALLLGDSPDIPAIILPSVKAFMSFIETRQIKIYPDYVEHRMLHYDHRYSGTLDAVAMIDGKIGILDIKTSQSIYRDYNLQTSAYFAVMKEKVSGLFTRWILRIDQHKICVKCGSLLRSKGGNDKIRHLSNGNGKFCVHEWGEMIGQIELKEFPDWENDFEAFLGAKRLWEWENESLLRQVGYLS